MANLMDDKHRGLYAKYHVTRVDGSSEPGGRHEHCRYFVLDTDHDPHSVAGLRGYLIACRRSHPKLSEDLMTLVHQIVLGRGIPAFSLAWDEPGSDPVADLHAVANTYRVNSSPDDIRELGWSVAVHNDYTIDLVPHTFWLFTKGDRCAKGEGPTDADALGEVRRQIFEIENELSVDPERND